MLSQAKLFVLAGTHDKFTEDEFKHLKVRKNATLLADRDK